MPVETIYPAKRLRGSALTVEDAYAACTRLARAHYENFPVGLLVPRHRRKHVHAIYAFARTADDFADEGYESSSKFNSAAPTADERRAKLDEWERQLLAPRGSGGLHFNFVALHETIRELGLPLSLFTDLLSAFRQDIEQRRYVDFAELLDYCRRSANPIGRLVLLLHEVRAPELHLLSDAICTGLQLANFWQDVNVDLEKDRIYLPSDERARFSVSEAALVARQVDSAYRDLIRFQVERTRQIFLRGEPLTRRLRGLLRLEIRLTWLGGMTILQKIEALDYDTLRQRPAVGKGDLFRLLLRALIT